MNGFERRKEQSREDIRRAAEQLFSRFGTDRVSVNDIAREAGVSQATIYNTSTVRTNWFPIITIRSSRKLPALFAIYWL
jgi:DNA-binding transcriptional regulator YbjK